MAGKHVANSAGKRAAGGGRGGFVLLGLLAVVLAGYVGQIGRASCRERV